MEVIYNHHGQKYATFAPNCDQRSLNKKHAKKKMAAKRRSEVDYVQLNSLSSVVLYDTTKRSRGRLWPTERIIEWRRTKHVGILFMTSLQFVRLK